MAQANPNKVLYFGYPVMFWASPLRWTLYLITGPFIIGLVLYFRWWFRCYSTRLRLTSDEVVFYRGVFNVTTTEVRIADIRAVEVDQTLWGRMTGIGTIRIASAGSDGWEINVDAMPNPKKIRRIINEGRHAASANGANSDD